MDGAELIALGGDPGLAFVNSSAAPNKVRIELIRDGASYVTFLQDAELIDEDDARVVHARFGTDELDEVARQAVELRAWVRPIVADWSAAATRTVPTLVIDRLNQILALDRRHRVVDVAAETGELVSRERRSWQQPGQLLVPPMAAIAHLLTEADRALVRKCESSACTLWFEDHTKSHRRRWCSMALCGNREKARAHRERARDDSGAPRRESTT